MTEVNENANAEITDAVAEPSRTPEGFDTQDEAKKRIATISENELIATLQQSLYPGASEHAIKLVLTACAATGLDVMTKPYEIVPMSTKYPDGKWYNIEVLMPSISNYRVRAERSGRYGGMTEPEFGPIETLEADGTIYPEWCRITVFKYVDGEEEPLEVTITERWLETYATAGRDSKKANAMWAKRPYGQLAKCTEAQCLRRAFPEFVGGAPTFEEMAGKPLNPQDAEAVTFTPSGDQSATAAAIDTLKDAKKPSGEADVEDAEVIEQETASSVAPSFEEIETMISKAENRDQLSEAMGLLAGNPNIDDDNRKVLAAFANKTAEEKGF